MDNSSKVITHEEENPENTSSTMSQCSRLLRICDLARSLRVGMSYCNRLASWPPDTSKAGYLVCESINGLR